MKNAEDVARIAMGTNDNDKEGDSDKGAPLPPGPNYGPFGYFRLALLVLAVIVAALALMNLMA